MTITTILMLALLAWAALAVGTLAVGYLLGRRAIRPARVAGALAGFGGLLCGGLVLGTRSLAVQNGSLVTREAVLLGGTFALALLGGFGWGYLKESGAGARARVVAAATGLIILAVLSAPYRWHRQIAEALQEMEMDKKPPKYIPEKNIACPDNLMRLYRAFAMYAQDWDALPPAGNWNDNEELTSKVLQNEWMHCPQVSNRHDERYGYAYNDNVAGRALHGRPLGQLSDASRTPLLYDSTNLAKNAHDPVMTRPKPGRHDGRNSVLYLDGHVEQVQ